MTYISVTCLSGLVFTAVNLLEQLNVASLSNSLLRAIYFAEINDYHEHEYDDRASATVKSVTRKGRQHGSRHHDHRDPLYDHDANLRCLCMGVICSNLL